MDHAKRRLLHAFGASLLTAGWVPKVLASSPQLLYHYGQLPAPDAVQRVFAAGPPAAVLLYCLAPEKMLGWPYNLSDQSRFYLSPDYQQIPFVGRLAGRGSTIPLESLLALSPDVILDAGVVNQTHQSAAENVARQTGIPYVLVDGTLADSPRQLLYAGELLQVSERAAMLAAHATEILDKTANAVAKQAPSVYLARGIDGLETGLAGSIHAEVISHVGARNVAAAAGTGGLAQVSMEQLLAWDPDFIFAQDAAFFETAKRSPLWNSLRAVREGRLLLVPSLPFGWVDVPPGINRLLGLLWVKATLEQDQLWLPDRVREFFLRFYQRLLTMEELQGLLAQPVYKAH
ncbi:iron ABC transporter substrate-binding protein [Paenalcaligenes sp. Me52]|uniref:iron ABC transporter substrate-binding protein n=1 Tax=Paenalcaligenes sp. Me52 TaxID=3392038 RepID=UPI003D2D606E